jgi:ferredoxin
MTLPPAARRRPGPRQRAGSSSARLEIDWTRCDGHGLCAALLPTAIGRDEWGYPVLDPAASAVAGGAAVNRVVAACPALALRRVDTVAADAR